MAHFYGKLTGAGKAVTKTGTKTSGASARVDGWNTGAIVTIEHDKSTGRDTVKIYITKGSNRGSAATQIAEYTEGDIEPRVWRVGTKEEKK